MGVSIPMVLTMIDGMPKYSQEEYARATLLVVLVLFIVALFLRLSNQIYLHGLLDVIRSQLIMIRLQKISIDVFAKGASMQEASMMESQADGKSGKHLLHRHLT